MKVSISILKSKIPRNECINNLNKTDADFIHVDVMDGIFVPNKSLDINEINNIFKNNDKKLDIHLMVSDPKYYIDNIKVNNINDFIIHEEIDKDINSLIDLIHSKGYKAGIAINPETDINKIYKYLGNIDIILIMGVHPGKGGQQLITSTIDKISSLIKLRNMINYKYLISFDGGVNVTNIKLLQGLDIVVSGSYVCMSDNYQEKINKLR